MNPRFNILTQPAAYTCLRTDLPGFSSVCGIQTTIKQLPKLGVFEQTF